MGSSPVALDIEALEAEVADDCVDGCELGTGAKEGVCGGKMDRGFTAGGQIVGEVVDTPGDDAVTRGAEEVAVVNFAREEWDAGVGAVVFRSVAGQEEPVFVLPDGSIKGPEGNYNGVCAVDLTVGVDSSLWISKKSVLRAYFNLCPP